MQHWDDYWQRTKTLNSFAEGEQGLGYSGEIAAFWRSKFSELSDNACLLDLATGNGGLAVLALQFNQRFNVVASDKADIAPLQLFNEQDRHYSYLKKIQFFGNMASENITFAERSFDMVMSQFGFEYAQPEPTLLQLYRVLKPGGKMVALVHHNASFISDDCKVGIDVLSYFLKDGGLLAKAREFAGFCQQLPGPDKLSSEQRQLLKQHSDRLLASFVAVQRECDAEQQSWFNDIAKDLIPVLGNWQSLTVQIIESCWLRLNYFSQRLTDQLDATWDDSKMKLAEALAIEQGFEVSCTTLNTEFGTLCWVFEITK